MEHGSEIAVEIMILLAFGTTLLATFFTLFSKMQLMVV